MLVEVNKKKKRFIKIDFSEKLLEENKKSK